MSLLGFDAVGRWAVGQLPQNGSMVLAASLGTFAESGKAAVFKLSQLSATTSYAVSGNAALFKNALAAPVVAYNLTGVAVGFRFLAPLVVGSYSVTGRSAAFKLVMSEASGSFVVTGFAVNEIILQAAAGAPFVVTGYPALFRRDFINWLPSREPSQVWSAINDPSDFNTIPDTGQFFTTDAGLLGVGARRGPQRVPKWAPRKGISTIWTIDPAPQIPPPVTH